MKKIKEIQNYLNQTFMEREDIIESLFVSVIARQHMLLIGPPGTAKSALIMEFTKQLTGISYFQWLLTRFSTPEELFGPVSLQELEKGVYKRNTANKLPEANIAFLDEVFKSNSAILNALLTLINERLFYNNGAPVQSPLISVIGGSNEYPEEDGLEALFDRFLLRFELNYIQDDTNFMAMLQGDHLYVQPPQPLTSDEIVQMQDMSDMVTVPQEVLKTLIRIRKELQDEGIRPSDRRYRQSLSLIKAKAALDGRSSAVLKDLDILKHALWETEDQISKTAEIIEAYTVDTCQKELERILLIAKETYMTVQNDGSTEVGMEATTKLKACLNELVVLENQYPERSEEIQKMKKRVIEAQEAIGQVLLGL
ncbi:AAA family ATPase [Bacillus sp. 1P06AnD]|uniref:AAA family ATPase n=1 Tax=Bacillus sp. 1P06AnD TaxID=3132208 RepID=UPI0039A11345